MTARERRGKRHEHDFVVYFPSKLKTSLLSHWQLGNWVRLHNFEWVRWEAEAHCLRVRLGASSVP